MVPPSNRSRKPPGPMATDRPTEKTLKRLFAESGNRCAYPDCAIRVVQGSTILADVCHIKAANAGGSRYDAKQSAAERNGYENLILLCPTHHRLIDDDPKTYTVGYLLHMKADHERDSSPLGTAEVEHAVRLLLDQSVRSVNQSGGITAHTVHQTINLQVPGTDPRVTADQLLAQAAKLHEDRVDKIVRGAGPVPVLDGGMLILHVVPTSALTSSAPSAQFARISADAPRFPPIASTYSWESRTDFEGFLTGSNADGLKEPQRAYVMVFRSAVLEAVCSSLMRGRDRHYLVLPEVEKTIVESTGK
jgi:hypothetical protein